MTEMPPSPFGVLIEFAALPQAHRDALVTLGRQELDAGDIPTAIETLRVATMLDPQNPAPWRALADAHLAAREPEEADLYATFADDLEALR